MSKAAFKVLVVDDYEPFRQVVRSILELRDDLQIIGEASDGFEAVEKACALQPDLIVLDIGLPELNGISAAKRLRQITPEARILFVSEESSSDIVQEALGLGAAGYALKLRTHSELLPAIETVLCGRRFIGSGLDCQVSSSAVAPTRRHCHDLLMYSDDAVLLDAFSRFISAALKSGNPSLVLATGPHRGSLLRRLRSEGVAVDDAMEQGTCVWLDAAGDLDLNHFLDAIAGAMEAAIQAGQTDQPRLALCGERAGRLWAEGKTEAALQIEHKCNDLAKTHNIDILCAYPLVEDEGTERSFERISAAHTAGRSE